MTALAAVPPSRRRVFRDSCFPMLPRIHKSGVAGLVGSNLVDKLVTGSLAHVGLDVFLTREERLLDASW